MLGKSRESGTIGCPNSVFFERIVTSIAIPTQRAKLYVDCRL